MGFSSKYLGHGVGLRTIHFPQLAGEEPGGPVVDWVEAIAENFLIPGGRPLAVLERVRAERPVVLHGVSLSIASADPLNRRHLRELRGLADRIEPAWISDHLCWGSIGGHYAHDLLPFPFTEESLDWVVRRVGEVQDALGRQILLENVSSYLTFHDSALTEQTFLAELAVRADCGILLDVNNVHVAAKNHGFSAEAYLEAIPIDRVGQIHLAGHQDRGTYLFDSHDGPVSDPVWRLYRRAVRRFGRVSTLIEWDDRIPSLERLAAESRAAAAIMDEELRAKEKTARKSA
ncbi:MAG: MNIO family bufferin maturase [Deltaproteobacteria bacterium]